MTYGVVVAALLRVAAIDGRELLRTRSLWVLVLASGFTNATFNWGVTIGDVVRVVLLFYLMPMWTVLLARWLLHEPLHAGVVLRAVLAVTGALVVLWPRRRRLAVAARTRPIGWAWPAACRSRSTT